MPELQ